MTPSLKTRLGLVGLAYGGYNLGEELGPAKLREMHRLLAAQPVTVVPASRFVLTDADARAAGEELARADVDCILAVITTFVPDTFIVELLDACDKPVFLWCVERELQCISVVCGPLITATLFNLGKRYEIVGADIPGSGSASDVAAPARHAGVPRLRDEGGYGAGEEEDRALAGAATHSPLSRLLAFSRAAMLLRRLRTSRVGYCGGKCPMMFSMAVDEYAIKRQLGATVVNLPVEEFYDVAKAIPDAEAAGAWKEIKASVGEVTALEADGLLSTRYYLAARRLAERHGLDALSLNCFPHLKSKICLGVARLNDAGIAAGCEGDLHSTILMHALGGLTRRPAFNGDWLRMYPETNEVLFSHCGAGAFGLAQARDTDKTLNPIPGAGTPPSRSSLESTCSRDGLPGRGRPGSRGGEAKAYESVCLRCSIETKDGLAVCYATRMRGPVTLTNLMYGPDGLRLACLVGEAAETDLSYEGTPLKVRFAETPDTLLQRIARCGAGHHWNGAEGDYSRELSLLCEWTGLKFNILSY